MPTMSRSGRAFAFLRPGQRLPAIFVIGILLPGITLAVFSIRALLQERRLADQEIRERLDRVAKLAIRELDLELARWQREVEELAGSGLLVDLADTASPAAESLPETIREVFDAPAASVIVFRNGDDLGAYPPGRLLYGPTAPYRARAPEVQPRGLAEAEHAETVEKDYARAIGLYGHLLGQAAPRHRALLLHRLARTSKKAGLRDQAIRYYRELDQGDASLVGSLPFALIAKYELCVLWEEQGASSELATGARELYENLVAGRWPLEKSRYMFYSEQARDWLADSSAVSAESDPAQLEPLRSIELQKLALSEAAAEFLGRPRTPMERRRTLIAAGDRVNLALWNAEPLVALILSADFVEDRLWEPLVRDVGNSDFHFALQRLNGEIVFGDAPPGDLDLPLIRDLTGIGLPLSLQVWPSGNSTMLADLARRQSVYLAMLLLVVALLAFGSYITVHTVRQEVEVARLKSQFVSTVSHEFRSPLTGIRQLAEMLSRGRVKDEEKRQAYYQMIVRESSRLTRLVENVLDFSRIEEARVEYRLEPLEAGPWLRQAVREFQEEIADTGVAVVAEIPDELPFVRGDREALSCAVHNLLDNAVKYSADSDTVWLQARSIDGKLTVRVRDRGVGIPEGDQKHVFEKFFRGTGDGSAEVKGVGLGLSLVQHIVDAHGGSIGLASEPGVGSTFTIELPVDRAAPPRRSEPPAEG
ncbi:MAG: HAMP domain-containing histidine kinase [Acidobacteria bacterium]|nr:HAMP domain-containing histidine kinase [Acidobacteriota bacterium]